MQDPRDLYSKILGISRPWQVTEVELRQPEAAVHVTVTYEAEAGYRCPQCGQAGSRKDGRLRRWRHLDSKRSANRAWRRAPGLVTIRA